MFYAYFVFLAGLTKRPNQRRTRVKDWSGGQCYIAMYSADACHCRNFYQQRIDRIRNAEAAKRNRERIKDPSTFPTVPTGNP